MKLKEILETILEEDKKYFMNSFYIDSKLNTSPNDNILKSKKEILSRLSKFEIEEIKIFDKYIWLNDWVCITEYVLKEQGV